MSNIPPRTPSLVKLEPTYKKWLKEHLSDSPLLKEKDTFMFMGEVANMKGHCIVIGMESDTIYKNFHTDDFIELTEEEV